MGQVIPIRKLLFYATLMLLLATAVNAVEVSINSTWGKSFIVEDSSIYSGSGLANYGSYNRTLIGKPALGNYTTLYGINFSSLSHKILNITDFTINFYTYQLGGGGVPSVNFNYCNDSDLFNEGTITYINWVSNITNCSSADTVSGIGSVGWHQINLTTYASQELDDTRAFVLRIYNDTGAPNVQSYSYSKESPISVPYISMSFYTNGTPPSLSGCTPTSGTDRTPTISCTANETATCKWALTDINYSTMSNSCTNTNSTNVSCTLSGLTVNTNNTFYIACEDEFGNSDSNETNENLWYDLTNQLPTYTPNLANKTVPHHQNLTYDINSTDSDGDTVYYYINDSIATINETTGIITDNPSLSDTGIYVIQVTLNDTYNTTTSDFTYTITNNLSVVVANLTPIPAIASQNITCGYIVTDANSDTDQGNHTIWYRNAILMSAYDNITVFNSTNTSNDDVMVCSVSVYDGLNWSIYSNSSSLAIGDEDAPIIYNHSVNDSNVDIYNLETVNICVMVNDSFDINMVYVEIRNFNEDLLENFSMTATGNLYCKAYQPLTVMTYNVGKIIATDNSLNVNSTESNLTFNAIDSSPSGGGTSSGGGGLPPIVTTPKKDCDIGLNKDTIDFYIDEKVVQLVVKNNEETAYIPIFEIADFSFRGVEYQGYDQFNVFKEFADIPAGQSEPVTLLVLNKLDFNDTVETQLIITSDECNDIEIPIVYYNTKTKSKDLLIVFSNVMDFLKEKNFLDVANYVVLIASMLVCYGMIFYFGRGLGTASKLFLSNLLVLIIMGMVYII